MKHLVAPSILSADFARLGEAIEMINRSQADWIHVDVMDGHFVPNISFGQPVINSFKSIAQKPLDVHLMISNPEVYLEDFKKAGAHNLSVHLEACTHLHSVIQRIRALGMHPGVAVNPHSPVALLEDIIEDIDVVCMMGVNPGFGGQKYIQQTTEKVKKLRRMIDESASAAKIEIDGGVTLENAGAILEAGADVLVAGSTVFKSDDPVGTIEQLKTISVNTING